MNRTKTKFDCENLLFGFLRETVKIDISMFIENNVQKVSNFNSRIQFFPFFLTHFVSLVGTFCLKI